MPGRTAWTVSRLSPFVLGLALPVGGPAFADDLMWDTTGGVSSRPGSTSLSVRNLGENGEAIVDTEIADDFAAVGFVRRLVMVGVPCFCDTPEVVGVHARFHAWTPDGPGALQAEYFLSASDPGFIHDPEQPALLDITLPGDGFSATGKHFLAVQLVFDGGGAWSMLHSNDNRPVFSSLYFRDNLAGGEWEPETYHGPVVFSSDFSFALHGERTEAPMIDSISPAPVERSGWVRIRGSGFGSLGDGVVLIDGIPAWTPSWLPHEIRAYVPEGASLGSIDVRVVSPLGASDPASLDVRPRLPDGRVRWRFTTDGHGVPVQFITVDDAGRLYTSDLTGTYALDHSGALRWFTPEARGADGAGGRPIAIGPDGTLHTGVDVEDDAYASIVALDPDDGHTRWRYVAPNRGSIDIGPGVGPDGNIYAVQTVEPNAGLGMFSLDPAGMLRWSDPGAPDFSELIDITNSELAFGTDRVYAGAWSTRGGHPVTYGYSLGGEQAWTSWDLPDTGTSFPRTDPRQRVITTWGQTGIRAISAEGEEVWVRVHPDQANVRRPAVDADGNIYTGSSSGVRLWSLDPDGNTRWLRVFENPYGLGTLGVSPDGRVIVATGGADGSRPAWVRGYSTANGALLWHLDLPDEAGSPQIPSTLEPKFSPDSRTAYIATQFPRRTTDYGRVLAIQIQDDCAGDFNHDGQLNIFDFLAFQTAFSADLDSADLNGDGQLNLFDFLALQTAFGEGC